MRAYLPPFLLFLAAGCPTEPGRPDAFFPDAVAEPLDAARDGGTPDARQTMCRTPGGMCDIAAQDCPPMGTTPQVCVFVLPSATATRPESVCAPIVGSGAEEGQACCAVNSCDRGLFCDGAVQSGSTCSTMGRCTRYCCESGSTACPVGSTCQGFVDGHGIGFCAAAADCNLVLDMEGESTGCPGAEACYPSNRGTLQCALPTPTAAAHGAACEGLNACRAGSSCLRNVCRAFCDLADGAADCARHGGGVCEDVFAGLPTGVGTCPVPGT